MNEEIKKNIEAQMDMLREMSGYIHRIESATDAEKKLLEGAIGSLKNLMKLVNSAIPGIISESYGVKLPVPNKEDKRPALQILKISGEGKEIEVILKSRDKEKFLKELSINEEYIKKIRKKGLKIKKVEIKEFRAARGYLKLANKFFLRRAKKFADEGKFKNLYYSIKKANIDILFEGYIAMMFFTTLLATIFFFLLYIVLIFFDVGIVFPFFSIRESEFLLRALRVLWVPIVLPIVTFLSLYVYPSTEQKSLGTKIDQELPFAVIHMSAISGSGIAPAEIFKIIAFSKEYPHLRREVRKVINQTNIYGYDLVTALNNCAKTAPSSQLSDLFAGLSTTITAGSNLSSFFSKRSESLLLQYRLEREKYTKLIETFLDIYISVVIAAPMVFLLLLILMSISGADVQFTPLHLTIISVAGVALLNIIFLAILQIKEPPY